MPKSFSSGSDSKRTVSAYPPPGTGLKSRAGIIIALKFVPRTVRSRTNSCTSVRPAVF